MRKRILFVAPPFAGHLHPAIALAARLQPAYDVLVASTPSGERDVVRAGVSFAPLVPDDDAAVHAIVDTPQAVRNDPFRLDAQLRGNLALMGRFRIAFGTLCDRYEPALVVADSVLPVAGIAAVERGIRWWTLFTSAPAVFENPTAPPAYCGGLAPMPGVAGVLRDAAARFAVRGVKRAFFARYRRRFTELGFAHPYRADGSEALYSPERVLFTSYRELEFATVWPPSAAFVGPAFLAAPRATAPVPAPSGRKRVFVTFGTQRSGSREHMLAAIGMTARALPHVDLRLSLGGRDEPVAGASNLAIVPYADYAHEIAGASLVVHHAGAGIALACLAHGIPALAVPTDYDQFDNAARLCAAGVARRVRRLERLPTAVAAALDDDALAAAARRFVPIAESYAARRAFETLVHAALGSGPSEHAP